MLWLGGGASQMVCQSSRTLWRPAAAWGGATLKKAPQEVRRADRGSTRNASPHAQISTSGGLEPLASQKWSRAMV